MTPALEPEPCAALRPIRITFVMLVGTGASLAMIENGVKKMLAEKQMSAKTIASVQASEIRG